MSAQNSKLDIRGVTKTYGSFTALEPTTLTVAPGEFVTLLGPSGSGKTTLLSIVAGLIEPNAGSLWIDGRDATWLAPNDRDVGMVFQNYALFPHLTVFENIAFPLKMRREHPASIKRKVENILELVGLPSVMYRACTALSGGQQQRVALARCMVYQPSIILMDEPLGALDKQLRDRMQLEIKHLVNAQGITVLYVTHDQEEAIVMSNRICLMNHGKVVQLGTGTELYSRPNTLFAATFLGQSNIIRGRIIGYNAPGVAILEVAAGKVVGQCGTNLPVGTEVHFMVRPELMRFASPKETADNIIEATFRENVPVGSTTRSFATLDDGTNVSVCTLTGTEAADERITGARVRLAWQARDTIVLE